jgi:hypothetical protein
MPRAPRALPSSLLLPCVLLPRPAGAAERAAHPAEGARAPTLESQGPLPARRRSTEVSP